MNDLILSDPMTRVRVQALVENAVRITHSLPSADDFPPDRPWLKDVLLPQPAPEAVSVGIKLADGLVQAFDATGNRFFAEAEPPRLGIRKRTPFVRLEVTKAELRLGIHRVDDGVRLSIATTPDESFYGWGERFEAFRRTSGTLKAQTIDAFGPLQGRGESYSAVPFYLSNRGYGLFLLNSHTARWRIAAGRLTVEADGPGADYILIHGPTFKRIITTYTALTGRPPLMPKWAFGLWVTGYPQEVQEKVLAHVREHRKRDIPLDAVILDYHWEEGFHNFKWRKSLFPDPDGFISGLKALGARLGLITTPFANSHNLQFQKRVMQKVTQSPPPALLNDDERALLEYRAGLEKNYFAHPSAKWWFGKGGMIDFTNPEAAAWWNDLARPLYRQGAAFFKNDDGEYLPEDGHAANGMDGREYHNIYGFYYGKAIYEGMAPTPSLPRSGGTGEGEGRGLIYARSVWAGSQRYPAIFLGDQKPTFEAMRASLCAGLNMGLAGFAYWTADVFGLDGKTTPETHMRYAQWALLNPVARYFIRPLEIDDTRFPWSHGPDAEANFRKYAQLRYRLLPYFYTLAYDASQSGIPLIRPMLLEFQDDARFADCADQYMLGDRLLVAPVVEAGATSRRVLLPEGTWHDFWSERSWQGPCEIDYPAPLDCLPMLVRGGTILPMGPVVQHIPDGYRFEKLELHLYTPIYPAAAECLLYDDDGSTTAYRNGEYALLRVTVEERDGRPGIRSQAVAGNRNWEPEFQVILHK